MSAKRLYGLFYGFECQLNEESEYFGISDELRNKVEDILDDVDAGNLPTDGMSFKSRLNEDGIDEVHAKIVMTFCRLGSRFTGAIDKIATVKVRFFQL